MKKNLYLIRHGRQESKKCNVNVALDEVGITQAKRLAERLKSYELDALYSSELIRAVETAEIIEEATGVKNQVLAHIEEIDFGDWTGQTDDYIEEHYQEFREEWDKGEKDLAYPGGENGEAVAKRVMPVIEELISRKENNVAIVTHGGVIRAVLVKLLDIPMNRQRKIGKLLENTSITHLRYDTETKRFTIERFNDHAHLEGCKELLRNNWKTKY